MRRSWKQSLRVQKKLISPKAISFNCIAASFSSRRETSGIAGRTRHFPTTSRRSHVMARGIGIVFKTASPFDTPRLMNELVEWTRAELSRGWLHPLIVIAVFIVVFLEIHPFQDGNGRLSRILTTLLLLRAGYAYVPYGSLESVIEESKEAYYIALRRTQNTIRTREPDWQPWLLFFLKALRQQKQRLSAKIERERILLEHLPKLSEPPAPSMSRAWKAHGRDGGRTDRCKSEYHQGSLETANQGPPSRPPRSGSRELVLDGLTGLPSKPCLTTRRSGIVDRHEEADDLRPWYSPQEALREHAQLIVRIARCPERAFAPFRRVDATGLAIAARPIKMSDSGVPTDGRPI